MRKILLLVGLMLSLNVFSQDTTKIPTEEEYREYLKNQSKKHSGKQFPDFKIPVLGKGEFTNADLSGKITFVNFWFESCPPCIAETEALNELYAKLKDNPDFVFVSFTFEPEDAIKKFISKYKIKYQITRIEKSECYRLNRGDGFPTSFVLDRNALIRFYKGGGQTDKVKATEEVWSEIYPAILELL